MNRSRVAVIGAGSWGTALAQTLSCLGHEVLLWAYETEVVKSIRNSGENSTYLPAIQLNRTIHATAELGEALEGARYVLTVMPSHVCRSL